MAATAATTSGFFELAGELPVVVEFFVDAAMADQLLKIIAEAELKLVYARLPAETGVTALAACSTS